MLNIISSNFFLSDLLGALRTVFVRDKMLKNASDADLVAEVVVEAATAKEPNLRHLAGKDVQQMGAAKKSMSDEEFQKMMKRGVMDT